MADQPRMQLAQQLVSGRARAMANRARNHDIQGTALRDGDPSEQIPARLDGHNMFMDEDYDGPILSEEDVARETMEPDARHRVQSYMRDKDKPEFGGDMDVFNSQVVDRLRGTDKYLGYPNKGADYSGFTGSSFDAPTYTARAQAGIKGYKSGGW